MTKLKRFSSILLVPGTGPTGPSRVASKIAARMHSRLKIVDAIEAVPTYVQVLAPQLDEIRKLARTAKMVQLEDLATPLRRHGISVDTELFTGDAAIEIVRDVLARGHDLVIVNAEPDAHNGCGTTAMRLLRKCPCPVWITRPAPARRTFKIVAAVDTVPEDRGRASLNSKILRTARLIADTFGAELHVLHAWAAYGESVLHGSYRVRKQVVREYISDTKIAHQKELNALLKACHMRLPADRVHLIRGDSREILPAFCRVKKADLLVMGTAARTGISGAIMGNTAEVVVSRSECSMVVVKPAGFVTPIDLEQHRGRPLDAPL